ncbi:MULTISPECIES: AlpA family transcriptional regulator [Idiomarina]|uniref:AlpA family transcriptional regulator n=1 Tax=Idiomarina TaxID=135575 RepID=UPI000C63C7FF|nr:MULTISPECIES: AlpA family transcriptional regulator [Idiomarina]MAO68409.1 transcriptional regulator [Idiomarina sp.]MBF80747.1 transcriptional regulator [Idiomarina sp.]
MRFIRLKEVVNKVVLSRSSIYRRIANEDFPKPILLGGRASGWIESEVDEWLMQCVRKSRDQEVTQFASNH